MREGRARELVSRRVGQRVGRDDLLEDRVVLAGAREDADVFVVLRRGAHHGRPADVDQFDRGIGAKGIEVADDEVDGRDVVFGEGREVLGLGPVGQDARVEPGMQRLDATVQHLGKAGHVGDFQVLDAGRAESRGRAAGGDQLDAVSAQSRSEFDESGLVPDAQQRSHLFLQRSRD